MVRFDPVMQAIMLLGPISPRHLELHRISPMTFRSLDVSVVLDMMIHDLDLLQMLIEPSPRTSRPAVCRCSAKRSMSAMHGSRFLPARAASVRRQCHGQPTCPQDGTEDPNHQRGPLPVRRLRDPVRHGGATVPMPIGSRNSGPGSKMARI